MNVYFSRHAKRRMKERKILQEEIFQVLKYPDQVTPSIKDRVNYIKKMENTYLKVTCKDEGEIRIIITVMGRNV